MSQQRDEASVDEKSAPWHRRIIRTMARRWSISLAIRRLEALDDMRLKDLGIARGEIAFNARFGRVKSGTRSPGSLDTSCHRPGGT